MDAPVAFVSHGAPSLALDAHDPTHRFLTGFGRVLGRPRAVLCISAHWDTAGPALTAGAAPETIHDFFGFPEPLYALRYPAPGAPWLAQRVRELLATIGEDAHLDPVRGLDHGAWVPLMLMYPEADVPVVQLSVQSRRSGAAHLALGAALAPLAAEGVLVLGSGGATHALGEAFASHRAAPDAPTPAWAARFDDWLRDALTRGDRAALEGWSSAPEAARNHPTPEHFLPLLVAAGAGSGAAAPVHSGFGWSVLSMAAYRWPVRGAADAAR
jgi:4,5-DOPA dioxygenase extradiol